MSPISDRSVTSCQAGRRGTAPFDMATQRVWGRVRRWLPMFALAVGVRLAYWVVVLPDYVPIADADQYRRLGRSIASGDGFQLVYPQTAMHATAFRPPLYPAVLAPGFAIFGSSSLWPARLLSVVLGSLVVVLVGVLAARIAGRTAGLVAAGVAAVYPPLLANDTLVLTEPLAFALLLGAILLVDRHRWLPAGVLLGLLVLTRPNVYLVVLILAIWLWRRLGLHQAVGLVAIAVLVVAPWLVRNRVQVGTWRPTTSDGLTIVAVYGLPSQRADTFVDPVFSPLYADPTHQGDRVDEGRWTRHLTEEGLRGLRQHPGYAATVVRRNARGYFEVDTTLNRFPEDSDGRLWSFRQATLPLYWLVTVAGLGGLVLALRRCRKALTVVLVLVAAQFVALSLVLVAPPRLRGPFDLAMCVGVGLLVGQGRRGRQRAADPVDAAAPEPATAGRSSAMRDRFRR